MTPTQVANAVGDIHPYQPSAGERSYNFFQSRVREDLATRVGATGLAGILDPLGMGYGATMKSRDIYWGLQEDVE
jgi:hypothetical protein